MRKLNFDLREYSNTDNSLYFKREMYANRDNELTAVIDLRNECIDIPYCVFQKVVEELKCMCYGKTFEEFKKVLCEISYFMCPINMTSCTKSKNRFTQALLWDVLEYKHIKKYKFDDMPAFSAGRWFLMYDNIPVINASATVNVYNFWSVNTTNIKKPAITDITLHINMDLLIEGSYINTRLSKISKLFIGKSFNNIVSRVNMSGESYAFNISVCKYAYGKAPSISIDRTSPFFVNTNNECKDNIKDTVYKRKDVIDSFKYMLSHKTLDILQDEK